MKGRQREKKPMQRKSEKFLKDFILILPTWYWEKPFNKDICTKAAMC